MGTDSNQEAEAEKRRKVLKWTLSKLYRADKKKRYLEDRLRRIAAEMNAPIGGSGYSPLPRNSGKVSDGAASIIIRLSEIEERVYRQKEAVDKALNTVMDIIDYLPEDDPEGGLEREIMEMHHIDFMRWKDISKAIPMSRSQVNRRYKAGLDKLISYKRIQKIIDDSEEEYDAWAAGKEE